MGRSRRKVMFRGEMRTYSEISAITGLHENTLRTRRSQGIDLDKPSRYESELLWFQGKQRTIGEIAHLTGRSYDAVRLRIARGLALDADEATVRAAKWAGEDTNVTNDKLYTEDDRRAQYIESYFWGGEPLTTVHDIVSMFECSTEEAIELHDQLRAEIFGPRATLEFIGECHGVSRERVRQVQERALEKLRTSPRASRELRAMRENSADQERARGYHPLHEQSTQKAG
jgi:DNA-directed RNA polymerase sigma subunit (sigma70/sigma32)